MGNEKRRMTKTEKKVILIMSIALVVAIGIFVGVLYVNDYYRATEKADRAMLGNEVVTIEESGNYYKLSCNDEARTADAKGIIFYPGGKVEETAYAPMLLELAEQGYEVYLVKMPAKLAVLGMNRAEPIMKEASHIKEWTMMGHSLGGAMAAAYCASHEEDVDQLVLLAAYSLEDISDTDIDVYSFYGSEDKVLNMEKYNECRSNLPTDLTEQVIDGGNHAFYAHYGPQEGDGEATITREEQQETVLDILLGEN